MLVSRTVQGNEDLWLLDGARMSRFTFDPASDRFRVWSPDGTRIVFYSTRTGGGDLYLKLASGVGAEERLAVPEQFKLPTSLSADGRFLLYQRTDPQTNSDLWVTSMAGDRTSSVFLKTPSFERFGAFSPDGRWVAYQSNESGRNEIFVRSSVPRAGGSGRCPRLAASFHVAARRQRAVLPQPGGSDDGSADHRHQGHDRTLRADRALFPTRIDGVGVDNQQGQQYDVAPDGRFLINTVLDNAVAPITLLMNWHPDEKK